MPIRHPEPALGERLVAGLLAGAAGTAALNVLTYLDMTVRGRPASELPARAVGRLTERTGLDLAPESDGQRRGEEPKAANRRQALGALMGFATGLAWGSTYALVRPRFEGVPLTVGGTALGLAAMVGTDLPLVAGKLTDPRTWSLPDWLADLLPHLAFGFCTALAYDRLVGQR